MRALREPDLAGELRLDLRGQRRTHLLDIRKAAVHDLEDRLTPEVAQVVPGARILTPRMEVPAAWEEPVRLRARVRIPGYFTRAGAIAVVPPSPVKLTGLTAISSEPERSMPVFLHYPFSKEIESRIWLPTGRCAGEPPGATAADGPDLRTGAEYEVQDDGKRQILITRRSVSVDRREFPVEDYPALRTFIAAVRETEARAVTLEVR